MSPLAVSVEALEKVYRTYSSPWQRLLEALVRRPRHHAFAALSGIDLEVARGEALGIVGENGAGKSTLLKILAGITAPTRGRVAVDGKLASILELGSGFHPEFTGRQNIRLNAAMLGLTEAEVERRLPDIVDFSELGEAIDHPVKTYSTGMAMRLGFAIAMQVDPDILIIDEALSVGDGYFQKKCMERLGRFLDEGKTLLFCSHAMYYVTALCRRALWLHRGRVAALGPATDVVRSYEHHLLRKAGSVEPQPRAADEPGAGPARFVEVSQWSDAARDTAAGATLRLRHGDPWSLEVAWEAEDPAAAFHLGVGINRTDGVEVVSLASRDDGLPAWRGLTRYRARLDLPALPMLKGEFMVYVFLLDGSGLHVYDRRLLGRAFTVEGDAYVFGLVEAEHAWTPQPEATDLAAERAAVRRGA